MENNKSKRKIPRNVLIVAFVALASGFGQDLITPALPGFLSLLGISLAGIGLIDGLLQGSTSIFRFVSGILSDRYKNRKGFIFFGYALSSIARPLLAISYSLPFIAVLRTLDGVGKGMKDAPRDALVADSASQEIRGRAFGFHRLVDTIGSVFGPLLAGGLLILLLPSLSTYRLIFALSVIPGLIALGLIWFGIREPQPSGKSIIKQKNKFPWQFWFFVIASVIAMMTKINDSLFLVRAGGIGIHPAWIPILFGGFTLLYALLSYPIGILSDKYGKLPFIASGWLVMAFVEYGFSGSPTIMTTLILFSFYGLFFALTEGSARALIADFVPQESRGSAYAIFHTFVGGAVILGGYGLGKIWDVFSLELAFRISAVGSLIGFLMMVILIFTDRRLNNKRTAD